MFPLDPPPGFEGYDPRAELSVYYRHLPHWRQAGCTYFVTFRLADSLPQSKLRELKQLRAELTEKCFAGRDPETDSVSLQCDSKAWEKVSREVMAATEKYLDQGMGSCVLRDPEVREILTDAFSKFHQKHYELGAWVVMPNHVHMIIRPLCGSGYSLEEVLQSRKKWSAKQINAAVQRTGPLWQQESFDRIVRDREHLWKAIQYIGNNPRKAGLGAPEATRWVSPEWAAAGWDFLDDQRR